MELLLDKLAKQALDIYATWTIDADLGSNTDSSQKFSSCKNISMDSENYCMYNPMFMILNMYIVHCSVHNI